MGHRGSGDDGVEVGSGGAGLEVVADRGGREEDS